MHAYPTQLADFLLDHWPETPPLGLERRPLAELLSTCFQASLTREEGRTVRFRLAAAAPERVIAALGREDFLPLTFSEALPLTLDNLRHLSPAAPFHSSIVCASASANAWSIWGVLHTGADWLAPTWGGRDHHHPLELPQVHVVGPGRLSVYAGEALVGSLVRGMIEATTSDVFNSEWLRDLFRANRRRFANAEDELGLADDALMRVIAQHMMRRALFLIRQAGNGGLILFADPDLFERAGAGRLLKLKYEFVSGEARERYRRLMRRLVRTLGDGSGRGHVNLERFLKVETPEVLGVEKSIFEVSSLIAALADVDGAVVIDKRLELVGFGAEVSGELSYPDTVWQALDMEAERRAPEAANAVGTRHRAAYRFVTAHPQGLAIVISHDGIVRFVANIGGDVVYFDQFLNW
ncbi:MAG TPA: hypothetical protein VMI54_15320 [Polyangiaceae bacterium]|nr:hypothetical protein [Polyangiaceae bacterium]